jgi:hypothetical protein
MRLVVEGTKRPTQDHASFERYSMDEGTDGMLYRVIANEVRVLNEYMSGALNGIFDVHELPKKFMVWRAIMEHRKDLFGNSTVRASWDKDWPPFRLVDLILEVSGEGKTEVMLFEFKTQGTAQGYIADLDKLSQPSERAARRFFCALVDEFDKDVQRSARINAVQGWSGNGYYAKPLIPVSEFLRFSTKSPRFRQNVQCIICVWEILPRSPNQGQAGEAERRAVCGALRSR